MDNITVKELIEKLQTLPQDNIVSEGVLTLVHETVNRNEIENKSLHFEGDIAVKRVLEILDNNHQSLYDFCFNEDIADGLCDILSQYDYYWDMIEENINWTIK